MAMSTLKAVKRSEMGTHKVRRLREQGMIPVIIYGHGETPMPISIDKRQVETAVHRGARLMQVEVDGQSQYVLVKDVQYDHYGKDVLHMDLARVNLDERVEVAVPITLRGKPVSGEEAGVLQLVTPVVRIECLVTQIPDDIRVNVADMKVGDMIKAKEVALPEGAKLLIDPELLICTVSIVTEEEVAVAEVAEGAAEPEVIGAKPEEGAEGEAAAGEEKPAKAEKAEKPEKKKE